MLLIIICTSLQATSCHNDSNWTDKCNVLLGREALSMFEIFHHFIAKRRNLGKTMYLQDTE